MIITQTADWKRIVNLLEINSISGIAGYVFEQLAEGDIPDEVMVRCCEAYYSTIALSTMREEAMKTLLEQLSRQGIDHLLFKGAVVKDLYTVPELRTLGDIDIAIQTKDRSLCHSFMLKLGYQSHDDMLFIDNLSELIKLIIENQSAGVYHPQDDVAPNTVEMIRFIRSIYGKKTYFSKTLCLFVKIFHKLPLMCKIYGGIKYDDSLSKCFDNRYQIVSFTRGMKLTYENDDISK